MAPRNTQPVYVGMPRIRAGLSAFLLAAGCLVLSGCMSIAAPVDPKGLEYEDRCYIEDSQFAFADQLYDRMGALHLVEKELCDFYQWKRCEVNEALYRLRKVHDLP